MLDWYQIATFFGIPTLIALIIGDLYARVKLSGKRVKLRKQNDDKEMMRSIVREEVEPIIENLKYLNKSNKYLEESNQATLRNELLNSYRACEDKGYRTTEDMQNWSHMYEAYKGLGGNSFIDSLKVDFENIATEDEFKKHH